ncbi:hypothetical protein PG991_006060 [Apiospora marii]|uniref:Nucleoside phosphorylase domain-containing protein n=1 Tax=Apiospora marii TaxID=335849 RepID=A0ABR1SB09_9PEZI
MAPKLQRADYHVAWIAPVPDLELLPSRLMLDEEHETPDYDTSYDDNIYTFGTMAGHNVVIATCPQGLTGNVNAGRVAGPMFKTFSGLRMALLVGIGGGIPRADPPADPTEDVHLGDVVVGWPGDGGPACVYYDLGKWHVDKPFEPRGVIDRPDRILLNALAMLASDHEVNRRQAAVFARELLRKIPGATIRGMEIGQMAIHPDLLPERFDMAPGSGGSTHRLLGSEQKLLPWEGSRLEQVPVIKTEVVQVLDLPFATSRRSPEAHGISLPHTLTAS